MSSGFRLRREIALCLAAFLALPIGSSASLLGQQTTPPQQTGAPSTAQPTPATSGSAAQAPETTPAASTSQPPTPSAPQQQPSQAPAPVGTAVAPYESGIGVAASRPAGAVIAPAKQKRSRSFIIKVSLLVGAAVAVGTVIGLSKASPSSPH